MFLRAEYRGPWADESLTGPETARILQPDSDRVILFHVVASGTCWVATDDGEKHWARHGDVIVLPYGDQHRIGGVEARPAGVSLRVRGPAARWTAADWVRTNIEYPLEQTTMPSSPGIVMSRLPEMLLVEVLRAADRAWTVLDHRGPP